MHYIDLPRDPIVGQIDPLKAHWSTNCLERGIRHDSDSETGLDHTQKGVKAGHVKFQLEWYRYMLGIGCNQLVSRAVRLKSNVVVVERFPNRDFTPISKRMVFVDHQNQSDRFVLNSFQPA